MFVFMAKLSLSTPTGQQQQDIRLYAHNDLLMWEGSGRGQMSKSYCSHHENDLEFNIFVH